MFALLPLVGGFLLGWLAPRKIAIAAQVFFFIVAVIVLTITAPNHGAHYSDTLWVAPALAAVSAGTLMAGFWLARRHERRSAGQ